MLCSLTGTDILEGQSFALGISCSINNLS